MIVRLKRVLGGVISINLRPFNDNMLFKDSEYRYFIGDHKVSWILFVTSEATLVCLDFIIEKFSVFRGMGQDR